ncbi:MAG: ABC transporter substrate-binding protein [Paracoccaceae bacterium]
MLSNPRQRIFNICLAAIAISSPAIAEEPVQGGDLVIATNGQEPACIDPLINATAGVIVSRNYSDSLFWQTEDGKFLPWLAEGYDVSADGKTYTLHIRKGVKFTDGAPLNAGAVKINFDYIVNPATKSQLGAAYLRPYDSSQIVDEYTLEVKLKQPYAPFINILAQSYFALLSPKQITESPETTCDAPIGSGPFIVKKWNKGSDIQFTRNPDYNWGPPGSHEGPAYVDNLDLLFIGEDEVRYNGLLTGEIDIVDFVPPQYFADVKANPDLGFIEAIRPGTSYALHLNNSRAPFNDLKVRKALLAAIDRPAIVDAASFGAWKAASYLTPSTPDYDPAVEDKIVYDPALANKLLDEDGWTERDSDGIRKKDGQRLVAIAPTDGTNAPRRRLSELAQAAARDVGIDIQIELLPWQQLSERMLKGDYDIYTGLWSSNTADMLWLRYATANIPKPELFGQNAAYFSLPAFDDLVEKARISSDPDERRQLYSKAQDLLVENVPSIPLYGDPRTAAFPHSIHGVKFDYAYLQPYWFDVWKEE